MQRQRQDDEDDERQIRLSSSVGTDAAVAAEEVVSSSGVEDLPPSQPEHTTHESIPSEPSANQSKLEHTSDKDKARIMANHLMDLLRLVKADSISIIDLERKKLPTSYLRALLKAISGSTTIRRIRLYKVGITDDHAKWIAEILQTSPALVDLDLGKNHLTNHGLMQFAQCLDHPTLSLKRLVLAGHAFSGRALSLLLDKVRNSNIESFKLSKASFAEARDSLERLLCSDTAISLCRLDLRQCGMHAHIDILKKALRMTPLTGLCLAENQFEDSHLDIIAQSLRYNTSLQILDLQRNEQITNVQSLLECLRTDNHTLQKLKLRHCDQIPTNAKERLLDVLLLNAHGPDLAARTKHSEQCIRELPDLEGSSSSDDGSSSFGENWCVICFERHESTVVLLPCRHQNCCAECAAKLKTCHMCREVVVKVLALS